MNLLEKFNNVEVMADNRISDTDRKFCVTTQEAYNNAGVKLKALYTEMEAIVNEQTSLCDGHIAFVAGCKDSMSNISDDIKHIHDRFVTRIVEYFEREYNVKLDIRTTCEHLIPSPPQVSHWSDEYKEASRKYNDEIMALSLSYEQIIDEIYAQLDGFSFEERAVNELKSKCYKAVHICRYWQKEDQETFEVKGDTLRLEYGCSFIDWCSYDNWQLTDDARIILNGIAHYFYGMLNYGNTMFRSLSQYRFNDNIHEFDSGFIKKVRLYKNSRADIKFVDSKCLNEFVEQYLKTKIGGFEND